MLLPLMTPGFITSSREWEKSRVVGITVTMFSCMSRRLACLVTARVKLQQAFRARNAADLACMNTESR
jgi:hypothetical protein